MWYNDCCDRLNWYGRDRIYRVRRQGEPTLGLCCSADAINTVPTEGYADELTGPGGTGF
jgi:hypothetical protein